jgi:hypothetical protein
VGLGSEPTLGLALDELAARREMIRGADVNVPDAENAATYLVRAAEAIDPDADCPASTSIPFNGFPPYPPQWFQLADASVAASPKTFELARRARSFDRSAWPAPPNPSGGPSLFAPLTGSALPKVHHLAVTLGDAALNMHAHGDDVAALETIRDGRQPRAGRCDVPRVERGAARAEPRHDRHVPAADHRDGPADRRGGGCGCLGTVNRPQQPPHLRSRIRRCGRRPARWSAR